VTSGFDNNNDGDVNDRPTYAALCSQLAGMARTISGLNCSNPSSAFVTRNAFNGPGAWNTNFQISRSFVLRKGEGAGNAEGFPGGFPGGGGDFGGGGNRGGGGGNRGGGGGGGSFGGGGGNRGGGRGNRGNNNGGPGATTATFFMNVQNALNHRNFQNPISTMTSPNFDQYIQASQPRTIELGVRLNF
jgi:hypothetical protein